MTKSIEAKPAKTNPSAFDLRVKHYPGMRCTLNGLPAVILGKPGDALVTVNTIDNEHFGLWGWDQVDATMQKDKKFSTK